MDLTRIDGIDVTTALVVVSEIGADMSRFPSDKHLASWLGLCPGTKITGEITGGKLISGKTKRCANRAAQALRLAAAAQPSSQSALGAYFRRMCSRMDKPTRSATRYEGRRYRAARLKTSSLISRLEGVSCERARTLPVS